MKKAANASTNDPVLAERKQELLNLQAGSATRVSTPITSDCAGRQSSGWQKNVPSPILRGKPEIWAAGTVHALGSLNFLFDKSQDRRELRLTLPPISRLRPAVLRRRRAQSVIMLKFAQLDPEWMTKQMQENFSSTFAMLDEMNELMGGGAVSGLTGLSGKSGSNSPFPALSAFLGGMDIQRNDRDSMRGRRVYRTRLSCLRSVLWPCRAVCGSQRLDKGAGA